MITINVKQEDIDNGKLKDGRSCPVKIVIDRVFPNCIFVNDINIHFRGKEISTPYNVANFINDFDRGDKVAPFSFELEEIVK